MVSIHFARWSILFFALAVVGPCAADSQMVEIEAGNGLRAVARFWKGDAGKPVAMILHGFLQTRDFSTVRSLAESLADDDYTVLAPTLTLGLMRRAQSLPCEAIHTHGMDMDVDEIGRWSRWLAE